MESYVKYVIYIIDKDGREFYVPTNENYHKHIQAFKKLQSENTSLNLDNYINYKGTNNITGYELASFLGANGNIVFFHTDVANYIKNKKEGTIIIPNNLTNIQKKKLIELIDNLNKEEFSFYVTESKFKNNKSFKIVHTPIKLALFQKESYNEKKIESRNIKCKNKKMMK